MASPKHTISSTERLLTLIRGKRITGPKKPPAELPAKTLRSTQKAASNVFALQKALTVGVDISHDGLNLVKIRQYSNKKQVVVDYRRVPFEPGLPIESKEFVRFFKSTLKQFCGPSKKVQLWGVVSSARLEMRYLRVPKVAKKQIANAAYWTYKKEVAFDENEMIFDFHVLGDISESGVTKTEIMVYTAPREDVDRLKMVFTTCGFKPEGITVAPFAIQNLFRGGWVDFPATNVCSLYIGQDWSRIDIFSHQNSVLSRGIKTGITSMIEAIREEVQEVSSSRQGGIYLEEFSDDEDFSGEIPPEDITAESPAGETSTGDTADTADKLFDGLAQTSFDSEAATGLKLSGDEIFEMCRPALERLVRQVERTLDHYTANFDKKVVTKLYLSGGICGHPRIVEYIYNQLGLSGGIIDPFDKIGAVAAGIEPPDTLKSRNAFALSVGLALSNNELTPNFICTYRDKERITRQHRLGQSLALASIVLMLVCFGAYWQMGRLVSQKEARVAQLSQEIARYQPRIDRNILLKLSVDSQRRNLALAASSRRCLSLAIISEIARLTPDNILLLSISANFGPATSKPKEAKSENIVVEGIATGDEAMHQSHFGAYLVQLKSSPLFKHITVNEKAVQYYHGKTVLRFSASMQLETGSKDRKA